MSTQPTDETVMALWRELPSEVQEGREPDDIRPWVAAVLNVAARSAPSGHTAGCVAGVACEPYCEAGA